MPPLELIANISDREGKSRKRQDKEDNDRKIAGPMGEIHGNLAQGIHAQPDKLDRRKTRKSRTDWHKHYWDTGASRPTEVE